MTYEFHATYDDMGSYAGNIRAWLTGPEGAVSILGLSMLDSHTPHGLNFYPPLPNGRFLTVVQLTLHYPGDESGCEFMQTVKTCRPVHWTIPYGANPFSLLAMDGDISLFERYMRYTYQDSFHVAPEFTVPADLVRRLFP